MGLLFFGYLLTIVVHGHTSVEKPGQASPFCKLGICARVGTGGGEGQVKGEGSRVHLKNQGGQE